MTNRTDTLELTIDRKPMTTKRAEPVRTTRKNDKTRPVPARTTKAPRLPATVGHACSG